MFDDLQLRSWIAFAFIFLRFRITNQIKKVDNLVLKIIFNKSNQFRLVHIFVCTDGTNQLILFVKKDNFPNRIVWFDLMWFDLLVSIWMYEMLRLFLLRNR